MNVYERVSHGTSDFPIGVHKTENISGFELYPHIHKEFEFLIMSRGGGKLFVEGDEYELTEGEGIFINSGALHMGIKTDNAPCSFFAVVFSPEIFGRFGNDLIMNRYVLPIIRGDIVFPSVFHKTEEWGREVLRCCSAIAELAEKMSVCYELEIKEMFFRIWCICTEHSEVRAEDQDKGLEKIKKAIEFIQNEYSGQLSLNDIAGSVGMSREHFCRSFSSVMHITPFDYVNRVRIDNGCRMLTESDMPIGGISELCGFNSFSYFSKKFRELTGQTPAEYRAKAKCERALSRKYFDFEVDNQG